MCNAIVKPAAVLIDRTILQLAWNDNPHGAGLAYLEHGRIAICKGYQSFAAFYRAYCKHEHRDLLIHFRFATHGPRTQDNAHPFQIAPDAAIMHNGILRDYAPAEVSLKSDTRHFLESIIVPALAQSKLSSAEFLSSPVTKSIVECVIGKANKLAALSPAGFTIFNEDCGEWSGGAWYSAGVPEENIWVRYAQRAGFRSSEPLYTGSELETDVESCMLCGEPSVARYRADEEVLCSRCHSWYAGY